MDEKCADLHKPFISYLFLVGVTVQSAESLSAAIPLGTSTKRANSKRANHGRSRLFQDRCRQCLGFQHAEDAFVDDSCVCCGQEQRRSFPRWRAERRILCLILFCSVLKERVISFSSGFSGSWDRHASSLSPTTNFCQQPREYGSGTMYLPTHLWPVPFGTQGVR